MGKRLSKSELLQEIGVERSRLDALLEQLTPRQMTQAGATLAGWSVKDILGHLIGWQQMNLDWYAAGLRGETPEMPAPGLTWRDIRKLNDRIYRKHHRRSLKAVLAGLQCFSPEDVGIDRRGLGPRFCSGWPVSLGPDQRGRLATTYEQTRPVTTVGRVSTSESG